MAQLIFKGPFHFDNLQNAPEINNPGIYIWGFTAKRNVNGVDYDIDDCKANPQLKSDGTVDLDNDQVFIPYYVGIASGKSGMNIKDRLADHHKNYLNFYTRLTDGYLLDVVSKIHFSHALKNGLINKGKVDYFKNQDFLKNKGLQCSKEKIAISDIPIYDKLFDIIDPLNKNNFSFVFCDITKSFFNSAIDNDSFKDLLELIESIVYFYLKGITISKCKNLDYINFINKAMSCIPVSNSSCNELFGSLPSESFKGKY